MKKLFVDPDIRSASTLDSAFYSDPILFEDSKEKIFARTWQYAGDTDLLRLQDQLVPHTILPGFLDEPILFSHAGDGNLHCLSNVCTHRGNILVEQACTQKEIYCRYHGRRFKMDGHFHRMPEFEGVADFPSPKDNLPHIPFGIWEKFAFIGLQPSMPFEEAIQEMSKRLAWLPVKEFNAEPILSRDYLVKAHWALYCENYLEGFHIPFVHPGLNDLVDYGSYTTEIFRYSNLQLGLSKNGEMVFDLPPASPDYGKQVAGYYFWLFPNVMFNFYPWGLSVNVVKPLGVNLTKVSFLTYMYDEAKGDQYSVAMIDKTEREDEAIVENVQKGVKSRFYDKGRYSPTREQGTHHFHRLIAEFMNKA